MVVTTLVTFGCRSRFITRAAAHSKRTQQSIAPQTMRERFTTRRRLLQLTLKSGWLLSARTNWFTLSAIVSYLVPSHELVAAKAKYGRTLGLTLQMESPNGSTIPIVDSTGTQWTIIAGQVAKNGVPIKYTSNVVLLLYWNHIVYHANKAGNWYQWNRTSWIAATDPRVGPTESAQGATLTSTTGALYDANLAKWTLVQSASSGLQIAVNGNPDTRTGNVVLLLYWNHIIYQQNSAGGWWNWVNNAWNPTSDPRLTSNVNVSVNLSTPTGKTVPNTLFGFCGGGLCYGNNRNNDFDVVFDPNFQASAAKLQPALIRLNCQQTAPMLQHIFANGVNNPDWTWLDNWVHNHSGFFNDSTSRLVFGIGPAFSDTSISPNTWASWAIAVANHLKAAGQECFWWEIGNEPDGLGGIGASTYASYFNAIADGLHSVNANYKCGGPVLSYWGSGGYDSVFLSSCASRIGFVVWHAYGFAGDATPSSSQAYQQALNYGNVSSVRNEVNGYGLANIPFGIMEYNMLLDGGNNSGFDSAMFSCLFMTGCFQSDPNFQMGAVWDLVGPNGGFSCIGNSFVGDNSTIDPQGWYLGLAGQIMPGAAVTTSTNLSNLQLLASKTGTTWALQIANYDTSGNTQTLNVGLIGGTVGKITMTQLSAGSAAVQQSALSSLSGIPCPSRSITFLSGTYS